VFLNLMEELGIECRVGHPAQIRAAEPRKQKNDRRDAELILKLPAENRFPAIWQPSKELLDVRRPARPRPLSSTIEETHGCSCLLEPSACGPPNVMHPGSAQSSIAERIAPTRRDSWPPSPGPSSPK